MFQILHSASGDVKWRAVLLQCPGICNGHILDGCLAITSAKKLLAVTLTVNLGPRFHKHNGRLAHAETPTDVVF